MMDVGQQAFHNLFGGSSTSSTSTPSASPLISTSVLPKVATPAATTAATPSVVSTATSTTSPKPALDVNQVDPVTMLQNAMTAEGLDPSQVKMTYQTQNVQYPGGSYTLNSVKCDLPNGRTLFIDANAMQTNPEIAALDLKWVEQNPYLPQGA